MQAYRYRHASPDHPGRLKLLGGRRGRLCCNTESAIKCPQARLGNVGTRDIRRIIPFHAGRANERQPTLYRDVTGIAQTSPRDQLINQTLAHDVEFFGNDRPDGRIIRQRATIDRDCFKGIINERLNMGL